MPRYVAFLRAINVGGRTVRMEQLRTLFEGLGFADVETFIASGNVLFTTDRTDRAPLETEVAAHLRQALGYDVDTFVRTAAEVAAVAGYEPFGASAVDGVHALYVAFLPAPPADEARQRLMTFRNDVDDFHVHGSEVYWLCRRKVSESTFSGAVLEKTLGQAATVRNTTTVRRLAAKVAKS